MSIIHIQNWCQMKEDWISNHPQSQASKGKSIVLTTIDHQALVAEGI